MDSYLKRFIRLITGLLICSLGIYLNLQANIGLAPWDAFAMGLSNLGGLSFGETNIMVSIAVLVLDFILREKIGFGTIINAILIGKFLDVLILWDFIPVASNFLVGTVLFIVAQFVLSLGCYFYIGSGMGCGPRDALMVALCKRLPKLSVGTVRGILEGIVLLVGWLLGGPVGLGTVISVFGISYIMEITFRFLHFDVKAVQHENVFDTIKIFCGKRTIVEQN